MSSCDIERNAEISMMRKEGATFQEIAEWYEISTARARQICTAFSNGDTKDEIIRNWEKKQEKKFETELEYRRMADLRRGGKEYVIMNGAEDLYLTAIEKADKHPPVYRYASADIHDALWFTLEEAKRIAKKRRARAIWVAAPTAIMVTSPGFSCTARMIKSQAASSCAGVSA